MPSWATGRRKPRRRYPSGLSLAAFVAAIGAFLAYGVLPEPANISGGPISGYVERVVDGDTLDIAGQRIRLAGIDGPERDQTCLSADGTSWPCGQAATDGLRAAVRNAQVTCEPERRDRYDRIIATCRLTGDGSHGDLGEALVEGGLAIATDRYRSDEAQARGAGIGIWQGKFATPSEWRADTGRADDAEGGNPSRFERFASWLSSLLGS
ncbi:MAG: thermonuclease family protein [Devosia sp.]